MRRFAGLVLLLFYWVTCVALGQSLDDEYVQIFRTIQEADTLSSTAPSQALAKYREAQAGLDRLHKGSPDWNALIVNYRLGYVAERIAALSPGATPPVAQTNAPSTARVAPPDASAAAAAEWKARSAALEQQLAGLQSDNALLQAKLKEALAMRPAAVDPAELAKAQDRAKSLEKENELLKASREKQPQAEADSKSLDEARRSAADATREAKEQAALVAKLTLEKEALATRLKQVSQQPAPAAETAASAAQIKDLQRQAQNDSKSLEEARRSAADATRKANEQAALVTKLTLEHQALATHLKQVSQQATPPPAQAAEPAATAAQIKDLEKQRSDLQRRLDSANKELAARKRKGSAPVNQELESELVAARARLEILEARATPYSDEEQALLKHPETKLADSTTKPAARKSIKDLPPGAAAQIAEAQRYFAAKEYDKAEAAYTRVLQQDPKNVALLGNLAAIQVESRHFDQADSNIQQALALDSQDPYSLYVLGILRFREKKYDDALGALSRSAKLDPQNPEVQNYLGLALSEKGLRVPAEAALRKAIQLQPGYAGAHYNLAVVYATEQPPATELARFHYQKALAAGYPPNPDLEKRFEAR
ncbi:MAG TPA: tetratricopeptide repeat protein [Candidatus Dormibacteraeota bacterium]|nr:tetratricopeptide repeat protein [Candidatus Dormibacteraeota bacterium]